MDNDVYVIYSPVKLPRGKEGEKKENFYARSLEGSMEIVCENTIGTRGQCVIAMLPRIDIE